MGNNFTKELLSLDKLKSTFLYLSSLWSIATAISIPALAQIIPDTTLNNSSSKVNSQNLNNLLIEGGVKNQSNLFHSFQEFNINNGQQVFFRNPQGINNIITRITGNNPSNINGVLGINGLANLFFINPNGIVFGKDARLDVKGSFIGSTAESIKFSENNIFSAVEPNNPALLKINVPLGLQYGNNPAAIQLKQANLQVKSGKTLGLIGGNISLDNTIIKAPGGTIQLGGLSASGIVNLNDLKSFSFPENVQLGDVSLTNKSNIEVIAGGGGDIFVNSNNLNLNNSNLRGGIKNGLGSKDAVAGNINIYATGDINLRESSSISNNLLQNSLGNGGNINLQARNLISHDTALADSSSAIETSTYSVGKGGNINLDLTEKLVLNSQVPSINLRDRSSIGGVTSLVQRDGKGNGGSVNIQAQELTLNQNVWIASQSRGNADGGNINIQIEKFTLTNGAKVSVTTSESGKGGNLNIQATESIDIKDVWSGITAVASSKSTGDGGEVFLRTNRLTVLNGAFITADTFGKGKGGNINIEARDSIELIGKNQQGFSSDVVTASRRNATGNGGDLIIKTGYLFMHDGSAIDAGTSTVGNGGNITILASKGVELSGSNNGLINAIRAESSRGNGTAGNIFIETPSLKMFDGSQISAATLGSGNGGNIFIKAHNSVEIADFTTINSDSFGVDAGRRGFNIPIFDASGDVPSGIFSSSPGIGNAGDLNIETGKLTINNNAQISVSSQQLGAAGNLEIQANQIYLNNATISADTVAGDKGSIYLNGADIRLRRGSQVTTNATQTATGGNIDIDNLTLVGLENSDITANAEDSFGGRVIINAEALFGINFRDFLTPESDITATSALGAEFNGVVEINTPDIDPTSGLEELPEGFTDSSQIQAGCAAEGGNRFAETGRGGLPKTPQEVLRSQVVVEDWRISAGESFQEVNNANLKPTKEPIKESKKDKATPIVEARRWIVNQDGVVEFVANLPQDNISFKNSSLNCG